MAIVKAPEIDISQELIDAVESFPTTRETSHCGQTFAISPFDLYATCPACGTRYKLRAFSSHLEVEDLFDAFFKWMQQPKSASLVAARQQQLDDD
jgi:hypothetical protein